MFNIYSITKNKDPFNCLKIISEYNQEIVNIKQSKKNNPYREAIDFLKNIADNMNEKSCLFGFVLQYNSGISTDIIILKESEENKNNNKKYELSMLTVNEVINHLKDILPNIIIRYTCNDNIYAFHSTYNDVIFINEK